MVKTISFGRGCDVWVMALGLKYAIIVVQRIPLILWSIKKVSGTVCIAQTKRKEEKSMNVVDVIGLIGWVCREVEEYSAAATGEEKKQAAMESFKEFVAKTNINVPKFVMDNLSGIIDFVVFLYNFVSAFKKKEK